MYYGFRLLFISFILAITSVACALVKDVEYAASWSGFTVDEARQWDQAGFTRQDAEIWRLHLKTTSNPLQAAIQFRKANFNPEQGEHWLEIRSGNPLEAVEYAERKFTPEQAILWRKENFTAESASRWITAGFALDLAKEMSNIGFRPNEINNLMKKGFSVNDIKQWGSIIKDYEEGEDIAIKWRNAGFSAKEAEEYIGNPFEPSLSVETAMLVRKHCSNKLTRGSPAQVNAYQAKDKCFYLAGKALLLLGRNRILAQDIRTDYLEEAFLGVSGGNYLIIDFGSQPAPGKNTVFGQLIRINGMENYNGHNLVRAVVVTP